MKNEKADIRREILRQRELIEKEERKRASLLLTERILGHQWYYLSDVLLGFMPYGSEIDIRDILRDALTRGKKVYLPKVMGEEMEFYRILSLDELQEGYKGIGEPVGDTEVFRYEEQAAKRTLMLMPGVAFDRSRNRVGYGKGYYDRYLQDKADLQLRTIAVGFQCQIVEDIPAQETDIKPYQVICV